MTDLLIRPHILVVGAVDPLAVILPWSIAHVSFPTRTHWLFASGIHQRFPVSNSKTLVTAWLDGFERISRYNRRDAGTQLNNVIISLSGVARMWFINHKEDFEDWTNLSHSLSGPTTVSRRRSAVELVLQRSAGRRVVRLISCVGDVPIQKSKTHHQGHPGRRFPASHQQEPTNRGTSDFHLQVGTRRSKLECPAASSVCRRGTWRTSSA